jgi:hypothetical protein
MKCLLCPAEIDALKAFPPQIGPQGQVIEDIMGKWNHAQAVGAWVHVALTAQTGGGSLTVLSGHICPAHPVKAGSIALTAVVHTSAKTATPPAPSPTTEAPATATTPTKGKERS